MFLTEKQHAVLTFIRDFIEDKGISPTLEEMAQYFGVSKVTIYEHVNALQDKGAVRKAANRKRSIEIIAPVASAGPARQVLTIRGRIAAGDFIEAIEDQSEFALDDISPRLGDCYMLRVQGDSMIDAHICPGDLVIVEPTDTAKDRELVVAMVEDQLTGNRKATLKQFFREADHVRLQPANAQYEPIRVRDVEIRGRVVGVVRTTG